MNPGALRRRILVLNRQRRYRIRRDSVVSFCAAVLRSLNRPEAALSIVFVGKPAIRSLNSRYRQKDYATDVLSFSYEGEMLEELPFLGEVLIAPEIALAQAVRFNSRLEKELRKLLVHGILHLLGYDHEKDKGEMNRIQAKLLRRKILADTPPLAVFKVNL
jgi:probable rRNA maturation factor